MTVSGTVLGMRVMLVLSEEGGTALLCVWNVDLIPPVYVLSVLILADYLPCQKILSSRPRKSMSVAIY